MENITKGDEQWSRALVVDDVGSARKVIEKLLSMMGFSNISVASSGEDALEKFSDSSVDIIISDYNLGDMTGIDLFRKIVDKTGDRKQPFLLVTSDTEIDEVNVLNSLGNSYYLLKPFSKDTLGAKIKEIKKNYNGPVPK